MILGRESSLQSHLAIPEILNRGIWGVGPTDKLPVQHAHLALNGVQLIHLCLGNLEFDDLQVFNDAGVGHTLRDDRVPKLQIPSHADLQARHRQLIRWSVKGISEIN